MPNTDNYLLYSPQSSVTGQKLGRYLNIPHGTSDPGHRVNKLIRWGTTQPIQYIPETQTYNLKSASQTAVNKLESLRTLQNAQIPVPNFSTNPEELEYPFLARRNTHTQGQDIQLILQNNDLEYADADHYTEYIPTQTEYRIHVINGQAVRIREKRFTGNPGNRIPHIRNYETGYTFHIPNEEPAGLAQATAAINALNLHFGAVDIIHGEDGNCYVLEVNTAPSLGENTLPVYAERFAEMLGLDNYPGMENVTFEDTSENN